MKNNEESEERRKFAAKYSSKWKGWTVLFLGATFLLGFLSNPNPGSILFAITLIPLGVYLLRGEGSNPRGLEKSEQRAKKLQAKIDDAKNTLAAARGGQAVVAYRNLESLLKSTKLPDYSSRLDEILREIDFDRSSITSVEIGSIPRLGFLNKTQIEIYRDWIISGQEAYDVDVSTKGEVHVEGSIQFDAKNNKVDTRTANIQFVSKDWSQSFAINPDSVNQARLIVSQLSVVVDSLKPSGVTTADISKMIEAILNNSGQPPAEKLQQLSELRYQRLLSDQEFEAAKAKVLGI
jgi:hypothetical protein